MVQNASAFYLSPEQLETDPEQAVSDLNDLFIGLQPPIGWVINESTGAAASDINCKLFPGNNQAFGIPVLGSSKCVAPHESNNRNNIALKLIGIFITALAARQGAPFWSDILKRLVSRVQQGGKE
jgi:hypothetical protein